MTLLFSEDVVQFTTISGTGAYLLNGGPTGKKTFVSVTGWDGNSVLYRVQSANGQVWEERFGLLTSGSPDQLARGTRLRSSTGGDINWPDTSQKVVMNLPQASVLALALNGNFSATGRPVWLQQGASWIDGSGNPYIHYLYTGTADIELGRTNTTTGTYTPTVQSTDAGATEGPTQELFRDSASPLANDFLGVFSWAARSSTGVKRVVGKILGQLLDAANTTEDFLLYIQTMVAGTLATRVMIGQGVQVGSAPADGDKGVGTINVDADYYADGWRLTGGGTLTDGATVNWNLKEEPVKTLTLGGNRALANPTNQRPGTFLLIVKQDATGSRTLSWASDYLFPGGTDPVLSTGANAVDVIAFVCDGTKLYGSILKAFA